MNVITSRPSQPGEGTPYVMKVPAPTSTTNRAANIRMQIRPEVYVTVCVPKSVLCVVDGQYYAAFWWVNVRGFAKYLPKKEILK